MPYYKPKLLTGRLSYECYDAGHILGSSTILLHFQDGGCDVRLAFSGDVGRPNLPVIRDPDPMPPADYLIMESTYGGRFHEAEGSVKDKLAAIINTTARRGGNVSSSGMSEAPANSRSDASAASCSATSPNSSSSPSA